MSKGMTRRTQDKMNSCYDWMARVSSSIRTLTEPSFTFTRQTRGTWMDGHRDGHFPHSMASDKYKWKCMQKMQKEVHSLPWQIIHMELVATMNHINTIAVLASLGSVPYFYAGFHKRNIRFKRKHNNNVRIKLNTHFNTYTPVFVCACIHPHNFLNWYTYDIHNYNYFLTFSHTSKFINLNTHAHT